MYDLFLVFLREKTLILDTTPKENMNGFDNKSAWNSVFLLSVDRNWCLVRNRIS